MMTSCMHSFQELKSVQYGGDFCDIGRIFWSVLIFSLLVTVLNNFRYSKPHEISYLPTLTCAINCTIFYFFIYHFILFYITQINIFLNLILLVFQLKLITHISCLRALTFLIIISNFKRCGTITVWHKTVHMGKKLDISRSLVWRYGNGLKHLYHFILFKSNRQKL